MVHEVYDDEPEVETLTLAEVNKMKVIQLKVGGAFTLRVSLLGFRYWAFAVHNTETCTDKTVLPSHKVIERFDRLPPHLHACHRITLLVVCLAYPGPLITL